jgi:hypothetical protein
LWKASAKRAFLNAEIMVAELGKLPAEQRQAFIETLARVMGVDVSQAQVALDQFQAADYNKAYADAAAKPKDTVIPTGPNGEIAEPFAGVTIEDTARRTREITNALRAHRANIGDTAQLPAQLGYTIHAGEQVKSVDPFELLRQVEQSVSLGADRIGHGLILSIDPTTLVRIKTENPGGEAGLNKDDIARFTAEQTRVREHVKAAGVVVEANITSNTEMANLTTSDHPAPKMIEQGLRVTVSTDNETTFATTVKEELSRLAEAPSVSRTDLALVVLEGFYSRIGSRELTDRARLKADYLDALTRGLSGDQLVDLADRLSGRFYVKFERSNPIATIQRALEAVFGGGG